MSNPKWYHYDWIWQKTSAVGFLNAHKRPLHCFENVCVFYNKQPLYNPQMRQGFKPYKKTKTGSKSTNYGKINGNKFAESKDGSRFPIDIITFKKDGNRVHPTQKPVKLLEYFIKTYTNEGQTVLDNTMGSGSTGIACVNTNRDFIGMELNEDYFKLATNRINQAKEEELQNETKLDI